MYFWALFRSRTSATFRLISSCFWASATRPLLRRGYLERAAEEPERWFVATNEDVLEDTVSRVRGLIKLATEQGVDTMIVSGDLDGLQLVDDHVRLLTTRMGVASTVIYDESRVVDRYGLRPDQMLDYKALKGDT